MHVPGSQRTRQSDSLRGLLNPDADPLFNRCSGDVSSYRTAHERGVRSGHVSELH
jgi:hypothetical protein